MEAGYTFEVPEGYETLINRVSFSHIDIRKEPISIEIGNILLPEGTGPFFYVTEYFNSYLYGFKDTYTFIHLSDMQIQYGDFTFNKVTYRFKNTSVNLAILLFPFGFLFPNRRIT